MRTQLHRLFNRMPTQRLLNQRVASAQLVALNQRVLARAPLCVPQESGQALVVPTSLSTPTPPHTPSTGSSS